jgi:CRP-like cAMP-binding protein
VPKSTIKMTNQDNFIQKLNEIHPIPSKEAEEISKRLNHLHLKAKQHLLYAGDISDSVFFVLEGLVRAYYHDENQQEHSTWFVAEEGFIYSVMSYVYKKPSFEYIEALEDTKVLKIKKQDIYELIQQSGNFSIIYSSLTEHYLAVYDQRQRSLQLKPEQRYLRFINQYPGLESRLKIDHLASHLGMSRSTLLGLSPKID